MSDTLMVMYVDPFNEFHITLSKMLYHVAWEDQ